MPFRGIDGKKAAKQLEKNEKESSNTQENGLLQKENAPLPSSNESKLEENTTAAQPEHRDAAPADTGEVLNLLENVGAAHSEDVAASVSKPEQREEDPAPVQEKAPLSPEAVCPESPSHPETNISTEHIATSASPTDVQQGSSKDAKPSAELTQNKEALSVPNADLTAAAGQEASDSEVALETNTEAPSW